MLREKFASIGRKINIIENYKESPDFKKRC
jgi:hypothetical protein